MYLINGQQPGPLIEADEGDDLEVFVKNELSVETTIHWHGKHHEDISPVEICHSRLWRIVRRELIP